MKKWVFVFASLIPVLACQQTEPEDTPPQPYLSLSIQERNASNTTDLFDIDVDANCDWTVNCPETWVEISPRLSSYHGSLSLNVRLAENEGITQRNATITFTYGSDFAVCRIHQDPFVPRLDISETEISFGYRTAEKTIRIISNCVWEAAQESSWIAIKPVTGLVGSFEMTVNAETNPSESPRSTRIHFWNDLYGVNEYVQVSQAEHPATENKDYVDEYGINRGPGITLRGLTWAAVNCGYDETSFPWGKMYQWGRKSRIGYKDDLFQDDFSSIAATLWQGKNGDEDPSSFYCPADDSRFAYDWIKTGDDSFWNLGTEEYPVKNKDFDPCPEGWRVPTAFEFQSLMEYAAQEWTEENGCAGLLFSIGEKLFLPAGGRLNASNGLSLDRNIEGYYWTLSSLTSGSSAYLYFNTEGGSVNRQGSRAGGCLVRCIRE